MGGGSDAKGGPHMKGTKRAAPVLQHQDGQAENGTERKTAHDSTQNDTTFRGGGQTGIASLLMHGAGNGIRLRELVQLTGTDGRTVRKRIELERRQGVAICADNKSGYYLAADERERQLFVNSMRHRAAEIEKTTAAVEGAEV